MRSLTLTIAGAVALVLVWPLAAGAQERIRPIEPVPCVDCWTPVVDTAVLDGLDAHVSVADGVVITHYRFELSAPPRLGRVGRQSVEGRLVVPVPAGSSVTDLVLSGGPETLEGQLLDANDASRLYEDIVRRLVDPALLRSLDGNLYEVRAFPVPRGERRQVSFDVTTPLIATGQEALVEVPWSRMSPRPSSAQVSVDVDVPWTVRSAIAPGFDLDEDRSGPGALALGWESGDGWTADTDLRLYLGGGQDLVETRLLPYRAGGEDGYFSLLFAPVIEVEGSIPRDVVLILDRSGSMEGDKMRQAIDAAVQVLQNLGPDDRFAVVDFSRSVHAFDSVLRPSADAAAGIEYVQGLMAGGNTDISAALERGLGFLDGERPGTVIFLTDGLATAGIEETEGILELVDRTASERSQLFTFGVGYDVDTLLLDALAADHTGTSHYVTPDERIDTEVSRLWEQVSTPVLADVSIAIDGVDTSDLAPAGIPGIFAGNQTLLTGRYSGSGPATITITGNAADGPRTFSYGVDFPARDEADPAIAQMWAQRRLADLLTEVRIEGARDTLIGQIVEIANRFGIVTPYTAYLAAEPDLALGTDWREASKQFAADAAEQLAGASQSGADAVGRAQQVEQLREGQASRGTGSSTVLGGHTFYLTEGTWTRDDYESGTAAPEVKVGSEVFLRLIGAEPGIAGAAGLGPRVITLGPDGWLTIVWPDPEAAA
jgi:Ca-activated chloride channel family protein